MSFVMVDIEADGPIPGDFSMVSFGAVIVEPGLARSFYGRLKPISEAWIPHALKVSGHTREETLEFDDPKLVMVQFAEWLKQNVKRQPQFISDKSWWTVFDTASERNPFEQRRHEAGKLYPLQGRSLALLRETPYR